MFPTTDLVHVMLGMSHLCNLYFRMILKLCQLVCQHPTHNFATRWRPCTSIASANKTCTNYVIINIFWTNRTELLKPKINILCSSFQNYTDHVSPDGSMLLLIVSIIWEFVPYKVNTVCAIRS